VREAGGSVAAGRIATLTGFTVAIWAVASDPRPLVLVLASGFILYSVLGGVLIARSGHLAGPLLSGAGIAGAAALGSASADRGSHVALIAVIASAVATGALAVTLVSLPEGHLASRGRRAVAALSITGIVVVTATAVTHGLSGASAGVGWWLGGSMLAAAGAGACFALIMRARAATGADRARVTVPAVGALLTAAAAAGLVLFGDGFSLDGRGPWSWAAWTTIGLVLPACLVVGAVRWKLFDVWRFAGYLADYRVWTASFVVLAAAVVGVTAGLLGLVMDVRWWSAMAIGASAVVAAALAGAGRDRLQDRVDRRFGQHQENPARTLEDLVERWGAKAWDPGSMRGPVFDLLAHVAPMVVVEGVDGVRFAVRTNDPEIGRHTFVHGAYDLPTMEVAMRLLGERGQELRGRSFLDVGANIGTAAVMAVRRFGASACLAIEPAPDNLELLRWNIVLNGMQDVATVFPVALSDHDGRLRLDLSDSNAGDHRLHTGPPVEPGRREERRGVEVDVIRLDELIDRGDIQLDTLGLLWMDVQGHEGQVLSGACKLLRSGIPIVVELWPAGLRRAGGVEAFWDALEGNYRWAVDLRAGSDERPRRASISELRASTGDADDPGWFTDILVTR
jgi:FkbM family methyltransferase